MKKAFKVIGFYILGFIAILLIGTAFYIAYLNVLHFSAGKSQFLFSKDLLVKAFFYVALCACILVCPLVTVFRIRHKGGLSQLISYIILCAVTWGILFPFFIGRANNSDILAAEPKVASAGYFRSTSDQVYYFTKDFQQDGQSVQSLVITPSEQNAVELKEIKPTQDFVLFEQAKPYNDIFTKQAFEKKGIASFFNFRLIIEQAVDSLAKGWNYWIFFLSIALALCSVYGISNFFNWRLLNTVSVMFMSFIILVCNTMYFSPSFELFRMKHLTGGLFESLGNAMNNPPLVLFNLLISIICIVVGIVMFFIKRKRVED